MDRLYRQSAFFLAVVAFGAAALFPLLGWASAGGRLVESATHVGLALLALGLFLGTIAEPE